jgi:hypothetical protein
MTFNLVYFACTKEDKPVYLALTDKTYDCYIAGEPQVGYHTCRYLGDVELTEEVIKEVIKSNELS